MKKTSVASSCEGKKADGSPCKARHLAHSSYCFFHDSARAKERRAAQRAGGIARSRQVAVLPPETPDRQVRKISDVADLLEETLNEVRRGELDPKVANSIVYISSVLLKALEKGPVEERLATLEAIVKQQSSVPRPFLSGEPERGFTFEPRADEENHHG